ncbi:MAG: TatD family hydrolase [Pseudomonadales bacterium]|nr:TatD family hydrolase [Pseudomonadales bacterium]
MLVDSHCHLDHLDLDPHGGDLDAALDAARAQGVTGFLCIGADPAGLPGVLDLARERPDVWATAGIHPLAVTGAPEPWETVRAALADPVVVGVGETGLDYFKDDEAGLADREAQRESFARHLEAGGAAGLPVVVHTREARTDTLALVARHGDPAHGGVLHCFAEDWATAVAAMDHNYWISISGIVTFRSAEALRDVVRRLPLERLLVETDAPWLSPAPWRGRPNEPARVRRVAECVAEVRGMALEALAEATTENFHRAFPRTRQSFAEPNSVSKTR